jgi:hypothetical protein
VYDIMYFMRTRVCARALSLQSSRKTETGRRVKTMRKDIKNIVSSSRETEKEKKMHANWKINSYFTRIEHAFFHSIVSSTDCGNHVYSSYINFEVSAFCLTIPVFIFFSACL